MALTAGSSVGPFEIVAPVGAGAMGEVYRARDHRIGRDVAVKVLPPSLTANADRLRRFEQEARAAGALNHPNVAAVYDVGTHDGSPYIVSELLEGETLRGRIGGAPLPLRKALDYSVQIARGLAAAHEKHVIHRDLKPENLFVTRDGQVKILDFGLAKLVGGEPLVGPSAGPVASSHLETETGTAAGTLMGTIGYMSPEQVEGLPADHRSDIFSLGAVIFEMVTGERAFKATTAVETMTAILREDPLQGTAGSVPGLGLGLERLLRHCLEKSPEERFQSARDLAFDLEALSSSEASGLRVAPARRVSQRLRTAMALVASLAAVAGLGALAGRWLGQPAPASFRQLTFRLGGISNARFTPDGQTVVYSAAWENNPWELFSIRSQGGGTQSLGYHRARILSISSSDELAILLLPPGGTPGGTGASFGWTSGGTLARVPLAAGGVPREILEDALDADWAPDGQSLAVARWVEGKCRLEFPVGKLLYQSDDAILTVRVSPDGQRVAFLQALASHGHLTTTFVIGVVDRAGSHKELSREWWPTGMAWSPSGKDLWFTAIQEGGATELRAVTLGGKQRLVERFPGFAGFADVSRDGRALILDDNGRFFVFARVAGEDADRNLSWNEDSTLTDLSGDGRTLLLSAMNFGGKDLDYGVFLRGTDGSPAVRLGDGFGYGLSPDGRWVLSFRAGGARLEFVLWPTRAGAPIRIAEGLPPTFHGAAWLPDSRSFVFSGASPGEGARLYVQNLDGAKPEPITAPEDDLRAPIVSPDGRQVAALDALRDIVLWGFDGSRSRPLAGVEEGEVPIQWRADGRALYVYKPSRLPVQVFELDIATGQRRLWKEIPISDPNAIDGNVVVVMTPDGRSYAYSFFRGMAQLYLAEGLE